MIAASSSGRDPSGLILLAFDARACGVRYVFRLQITCCIITYPANNCKFFLNLFLIFLRRSADSIFEYDYRTLKVPFTLFFRVPESHGEPGAIFFLCLSPTCTTVMNIL